MADFIKGDTLILYIYDTVAVAYQPIACITSNSLSSSNAVIETSTKCDPGVVIKTPGNLDYSLSVDGLYIDTTGVGGDITKESHDSLFALQQAKTKVTWKLDTGLSTNSEYFGSAYITDLNLDAPTGGENSTFSATLSGSGAIVTVDPIP